MKPLHEAATNLVTATSQAYQFAPCSYTWDAFLAALGLFEFLAERPDWIKEFLTFWEDLK